MTIFDDNNFVENHSRDVEFTFVIAFNDDEFLNSLVSFVKEIHIVDVVEHGHATSTRCINVKVFLTIIKGTILLLILVFYLLTILKNNK
jgi:hypothetical protein